MNQVAIDCKLNCKPWLKLPVYASPIATARAELKIPLGLPEEIGITPKMFTDCGAIGSPTDLKDRSFDILKSQRVRGSVGLGIEWESPVGPINIDWAHVIRQADFDITESFRVNFGQRF